MAYAALVSLAQLLEQIQYHEKKQLKTLRENIIFLATFFEDFAGEAAELEARITTAANQAEDIIEHHISDEPRPKNGMRFRNVLNCCQSTVCADYNGQSLYKKLLKSIKEIDSILKEVMQIKSCRTKDPRSNHSSGSTSSSSRLPPEGKDAMVGFEEHLMEVKARLCGESSQLQIIPIVGMGGIGKTTLAKYAHDDPLIVLHFDFRAWVTVSQDYNARRILLGLLYSTDASTKRKHEVMSNESLEENLDKHEVMSNESLEENGDKYEELIDESLRVEVHKYLKGRRYLIVLDDMWDTNVWDDLRRILPDDTNGSRVIITTRELDVASYADSSSHPYQMQLMNVDQSWRLLRQKVFGRERCPPKLENIGRLIAKNCKGLPLAITVIAGVLSRVDQMQDTWKDIARDVNKAVNTSDEQFLEILSLSYTHLPCHLRPCFIYMGGFPEDHEIKASKLIRLWIAEGLLGSNGSRDLEEVAEEYLEELVKRSLIFVIKKRSNGKIKAVKIHDLLRDLCLKKRSNGKIKAVKIHDLLRYLCLNKARDENFLHVINEFSFRYQERSQNSPIHTILLSGHNAIYSWKSLRLLRVMDAMGVRLKSYPVEISELFHLRYLALSFDYAKHRWGLEIPASLSNLQNLQTLILDHYSLSLPLEIWRMPQLRHLIMGGGLIPEPCIGMLALENLHTLVGVTPCCSQRIFEMIPNLKKLELTCFSWDIIETENLVYSHKLEKLKIYAKLYDEDSLSQNVAFPRTLKKLTLQGCRFDWKDMHLIGSLHNLEVLKLLDDACEGVKWETTEGEFCQLKVLLIDTTRLYDWITESDHFPRLERLVLYNCDRLRGIPECIGDIPTLQLIEVGPRNSSIVESAKRIEEEQRSYENDLLQIHPLQSRHWKFSESYW